MSWIRTSIGSPLMAAALVALAALAAAGVAGAQALAVIDDVVVDGERPEEPTAENLTIVVAAGGAAVTGRRGMDLAAGDEVRTGVGVQAMLRFPEVESEVDPLVIVDESSSYEITGPAVLTGFFGRLFASVAGLFSVITPAGRLGVEGTEFQVELGGGGELAVEVLEGVVVLEPVLLEEPESPAEPRAEAAPEPAPTVAAAPVAEATIDPGFRAEVSSPSLDPGAPTAAELERRRRQLEIYRRLIGRLEAGVGGGDPGDAERWRRFLALLETRAGDARETLAQPLRIEALERIDLGGDPRAAAPVEMDKEEVARALGWSSDVLVAVQPTYAGGGDAPHLAGVEARSEAFRRARFSAVWDNDPRARVRLGNVYKDWGENRRASRAYKLAAEADAGLEDSAEFVASWAEANRAAGRLEKATEQAKRALELDPRSGRANVALGNVYRSYAGRAEEAGDETLKERYLASSAALYQRASAVVDPSRGGEVRRVKGVAETNLAEVYTALAGTALAKGLTGVAEERLAAAEQAVIAADRTWPKGENPFLYLAEGQLLETRSQLAKARGDDAASRLELDKAQLSYAAALDKHRDMAPAHYRMARVYEEKGEPEKAEIEYEKAAEKQPAYSPVLERRERVETIERRPD